MLQEEQSLAKGGSLHVKMENALTGVAFAMVTLTVMIDLMNMAVVSSLRIN